MGLLRNLLSSLHSYFVFPLMGLSWAGKKLKLRRL
uniref:Uncharacterized protein n=1 Tax=Rhizophora mucronata TaxID=61149 RepID=A0A2P2P6F5_RHIMU